MTLLDEALGACQYIIPSRSGLYEPFACDGPMPMAASGHHPNHPNAWLALVCPVEDAAGEIIDIVAWLPDAPGTWWLRAGDGRVLGEHDIEMARDYRQPLWLVDTPAQWLAEWDPYTACILQRSRVRGLFDGIQVTRRRYADVG